MAEVSRRGSLGPIEVGCHVWDGDRCEIRHGTGMDVRFMSGECYEVAVRGHGSRWISRSRTGGDRAPTPTELFVAPLATAEAVTAPLPSGRP